MKRRCQKAPLPNGYGKNSSLSLHRGEYFHARLCVYNNWRTDENGPQIYGDGCHLKRSLKAVHLATEGISTHAGAQQTKARLFHKLSVRSFDLFAEKNESGTASVQGHTCPTTGDKRIQKTFPLKQDAHRGTLPTGKNDAIETIQALINSICAIKRATYLCDLCTATLQRLSVFAEGAL